MKLLVADGMQNRRWGIHLNDLTKVQFRSFVAVFQDAVNLLLPFLGAALAMHHADEWLDQGFEIRRRGAVTFCAPLPQYSIAIPRVFF